MTPQEVITFFGNQTKTADALGIKQSSVAIWLQSGRVPDLRQWQIELGTDGHLKAASRPLTKPLETWLA